jgi:hypothetical protein
MFNHEGKSEGMGQVALCGEFRVPCSDGFEAGSSNVAAPRRHRTAGFWNCGTTYRAPFLEDMAIRY